MRETFVVNNRFLSDCFNAHDLIYCAVTIAGDILFVVPRHFYFYRTEVCAHDPICKKESTVSCACASVCSCHSIVNYLISMISASPLFHSFSSLLNQ